MPKVQVRCRSSDDRRRRIAVDARHAARAGPALTVRRRAPGASAVIDRVTDKLFVISWPTPSSGSVGHRSVSRRRSEPGGGWRSQAAPSRPGQGRSRGHPLRPRSEAEELWQSATDMLTSSPDERYVSADYARELSNAASRPSMWSAYQTIRPSESKAGSRPFRTPRSGSSIFSCSSTCSRSRIRCGGPRLPESLPRRSRDGRSRAMCRLRYRRHKRSCTKRVRASASCCGARRNLRWTNSHRAAWPGTCRPASQGR